MPLEGRSASSSMTTGIITNLKSKSCTRQAQTTTPIQKVPEAPEHSSFHFGFSEDANTKRRRRMEDSHAFFYDFYAIPNCGFFAIYDGHGGKSAADWCGANLHRILRENWERDPKGAIPQLLDRTFMECDEQLDPEHGIFSGCTAIVSLILPDQQNPSIRTLYSANVGDARAVLCRRGKAIRLSFDHQARVPEEKQRIKECGGIVINDRVNGTLAVTRALGDASMKEFITGHPFTTETRLLPSEEDSFLILACDGLWDVCTDQEACDYIQSDLDDPQRCSELLINFALEQGSTDNLSVIVVRLEAKQRLKVLESEVESDDKITHDDPHESYRQ